MGRYKVKEGPFKIDLGPTCRNWVRSSVPFWFRNALHCANELHMIEGGHRRKVVIGFVRAPASGSVSVGMWG